MQIKASVIQIYGSYDAYFVITDKDFACKIPAGIRRSLHLLPEAAYNKTVSAGIPFFVRDTWCHDPDIYTAFCSEAQGGHHLIIYDQIWCADINIVFGAIDNIKINVLSYDLIVQGGNRRMAGHNRFPENRLGATCAEHNFRNQEKYLFW